MHKDIALLIQKIAMESPYDFKTKIHPNNTNGFWKIDIIFDHRGDAHSSAFVKSLPHIGMIYGEMLSIDDKEHIVKVN